MYLIYCSCTSAAASQNKTHTNNTSTHTHLDRLVVGLSLLERLPGVVHDVDFHALSLVTEVRVEVGTGSPINIVARCRFRLRSVRRANPEQPGLNLDQAGP